MQEVIEYFWAAAAPIVYLFIIGLLVALAKVLLDTIVHTEWFQSQPWIVRKAIRVSLEKFIEFNMQSAEDLKMAGEFTPEKQAALRDSAVIKTYNEVLSDKPFLPNHKIDPAKIQKIAKDELEPVLDKVKRKRIEALKRPGTKGGR